MSRVQNNYRKYFYKTLQKKFFLLVLIILLLLLIFSFRQSGYIKMTTAEEIIFYPNSYFYWFILILSLLFSIEFVPRILNRIDEKSLFILCSFFSLIVGFYIISNVGDNLRSDPEYVLNTAKLLNKGDKNVFIPEGLNQVDRYLSIFPNQVGLVTFERIYLFFTENVKVLFFLQLLMVQLIIFIQWKLTQLIFNNLSISKISILFSFLFLPLSFSILWLYGDIPGLLFLLAGYYYFVKHWKEHSRVSFILSIIFLTLSCLIRPNYQIFFIGIVCLIMFDFLREFNIKRFFYMLVLIISIFLSPILLKNAYEKNMEIEILSGPPSLSWVVMGINDNAASNGYWDGYTTFIYYNNQFDNIKTERNVKNDFKNRLNDFAKSKNYTIQFFKEKIKVTWNEPTFMSIYVGPLFARGQNVESSILRNLYGEGSLYKVYNSVMSVYLSIIYLLTFLLVFRLLFKRGTADIFIMYPLIVFIGGFTFHLIWETKSRYVMPYVFVLIPVISYQIHYLYQKIKYYSKDLFTREKAMFSQRSK